MHAVKNFQTSKSLTADGIVGPLTQNALINAVNSITSIRTINDFMYTTTDVHIRQGPNTTYISKGVLSANTKVYVYQIRADGWAYAKLNTTYGYIYSKYLSINPTIHSSTTSSLPTFTRHTQDLLEIIQNCKSYLACNHFIYSLASGARTIPADQSKPFDGNYCIDCSSYVSWVLYEYALANNLQDMQNYFSYQRSSRTFASIGASSGNNYLKVVDAKTSHPVDLSLAQAGDILVSDGHVEFFSSYTQTANTVSIKVYNCGSNHSILIDGISTSATKNISDITYILRVR